MRSRTRNPFSTVKTAGLLLPIDLLARIADGDPSLSGLTQESYHLDAGDRLNEAAARAWNECSAAWKRFRQELEKLPASDAGTTLTRERWLLPLFKELGYGRLQPQKAIPIEDKSYPISHAWGGHIPIHLVSCKLELDKRTPGAAGAASRSPYSLVQELLNRSAQHRWGFLSNGRMLYVLRDNVSLTRAANVEFDLEAMFDGDVFADFKLLFLLCHESRVEIPSDGKPEDCWLEKWSKLADDQGIQAREKLRFGVESAIKALGAGFLTTKGNAALRERLSTGGLAAQDYYRQLLRMVYRLLLLLVAEEKKDENGRNLLHPPGTPDQARQRYAQYYSVGRLRTLAGKRRGTTHTDLYESLRLLFLKLRTGYEPLGIPGLGSFLFSPTATPDLDAATLTNEFLLDAIRALCITDDTSGRGGVVRRPVDFANLGSDELGSVYESLLELHPKIDTDEGPFSLGTAAGHERKTTGSYYTPTSLINYLLDSALDPVAKVALNKPTPAEAENALLNLKVCDPACGSGHFLIAAAERLAKHLASLRTGDEEPSTLAIQHAKRDIIGRCIFGVDINPMSVELCQVALWMEALEPGKPFSFLEHHIQCGNSLIGTTPALLARGIPDDAFTAIEGDDKKLCTAFKKQNKDERRGQGNLFDERYPWERLGNLATAIAELDTLPDDTADNVRAKEERYRRLVEEGNYRTSGKFLADLWCAAFVWPKDRRFDYLITERSFRRVEANPHDVAPWMYDETRRLAGEFRFFHWHLAFPAIFRPPAKDTQPENELTGWNGGFDAILGNPPWEKVKLQEREFFATLDPQIAEARTAAVRKKLIAAHKTGNTREWQTYCTELRSFAAQSHVLRHSGVYPLTSSGEANTYSLFAELATNLVSARGRVGQVLKTGIVNAVENVAFFSEMVRSGRLASLRDFKNWLGWFPDVGYHERFSLVTLCGAYGGEECTYAFNCLDIREANDPEKIYKLSQEDIALLNPNVPVCPVFSTSRDAEITKAVYRRTSVLVNEKQNRNHWGIEYGTMFHMTSDSGEFRTYEDLNAAGFSLRGDQFFSSGDELYVPMLEGKHIQIFTHRFGTFEGVPPAERFGIKAAANAPTAAQLNDPTFEPMPRYWVSKDVFQTQSPEPLRHVGWCIAFRGITNLISNARTVMSAAVPARAFGNSAALLYCVQPDKSAILPLLLGVLNSVPLDFVARQKLFGANLNKYIMWQLPVPSPQQLSEWKLGKMSWSEFALPRVLELAYVADSLAPFAKSAGYEGPAFRWNDERRFLVRCELDASLFLLYGISRDDIPYILDSFPIVSSREIEKRGEYRTKRVILEIYDAMAEAIRTGHPYQTLLDPAPRPPKEPLPEWKPGQPKPANWPLHIHPPRGCRATLTDDWRLSDVADGGILPPSFKLILDDHEASNGVESHWKCKTIAAADALPEPDTWVLLRHPDLMRANKSIPVALGKLTYQELTDASTKQKVMVVTLRGPVPPAQVRIPLEEWPSFRPLAVLEPLD